MSTTVFKKRPRAEALKEAEAFRELFAGCYAAWEIAGSIRRGRPECGDCDHVVMPLQVPGADLFGEPVNAVWKRLDRLVAEKKLAQHLYGSHGKFSYRWGERLRGVDFAGFNHEIAMGDSANFGALLAIKTGPVEFSQRLVTSLWRQGRRNKDGYVWNCRGCDSCGGSNERKLDCPQCDGTGLIPVEKITAGGEREYFSLCGVEWREPKDRG